VFSYYIALQLDRQSIKDKSNQKDLKCATLEDDVAVLNDKIKLLSKSLERHSSSPQNHIGVVDSNEKESLQKELERTRDKLSLVEEKYDKAETQISKLQAKQKQRESIEEQINTSVSNKDTLISELEKTALLKDVEKANKRCSKAEKELALALSKQEDMDSIKEQLACCLKELDRYKEKENQSSQVTADQLQEKKALKVETVTREGAVDDKPSSQQVNDTTITSPKAADTPSSKGKHSSTKFSKFDSLKNRYLKKVQSPEPRPIYPSK